MGFHKSMFFFLFRFSPRIKAEVEVEKESCLDEQRVLMFFYLGWQGKVRRKERLTKVLLERS